MRSEVVIRLTPAEWEELEMAVLGRVERLYRESQKEAHPEVRVEELRRKAELNKRMLIRLTELRKENPGQQSAS